MNNKQLMVAQRLNRALSGNAGVYFSAAELTRRGFIATITSRNTKGIDILVSNENASKTLGIQVKTNQGSPDWWLLTKKAEDYFADNLFYILVNLNSGANPDYFIVPSKTVAHYVRDSHKEWLATPGRRGRRHKDNDMRWFQDAKKQYLNRWDLLGLDK